jgi:uncharacterized protein DUF3822
MMESEKNQITNNSKDLNNLNESHLSIQLSLDGFSFCIINKDITQIIVLRHFTFSNNSTTPQKHLENVEKLFKKEELLQRKYDSVNITHVNDLSTLVPKPLFDHDHLNDYLKYSSKIYKNDYIVYDEIDTHDIINVYVPFVNINNFFLEKFGSFEYKHFSTILIENLLNTYKFSEHPHMFVNIGENHFEIVIIGNNKLLFYNTFKYHTKEDFIYYVLFTAEQLNLNPEKMDLVFSGIISRENELYKIAYTYIRNVSLLENRSKYQFDSSINETTKRKFFTLIHQY